MLTYFLSQSFCLNNTEVLSDKQVSLLFLLCAVLEAFCPVSFCSVHTDGGAWRFKASRSLQTCDEFGTSAIHSAS